MRDRPSGTVRITAAEHAAETVPWPALERVLPDHPDIHVAVVSERALTDIVTEALRHRG